MGPESVPSADSRRLVADALDGLPEPVAPILRKIGPYKTAAISTDAFPTTGR